jgi:hypothetical protein
MLPQALYVMEAWGFEFKSSFVWVKPRVGTGYWNRNRHELLLLGTRGKVPCPAPGMQWDSVIEAASGRQHSEKPEAAYELIELFPEPAEDRVDRTQAAAGLGCVGTRSTGGRGYRRPPPPRIRRGGAAMTDATSTVAMRCQMCSSRSVMRLALSSPSFGFHRQRWP